MWVSEKKKLCFSYKAEKCAHFIKEEGKTSRFAHHIPSAERLNGNKFQGYKSENWRISMWKHSVHTLRAGRNVSRCRSRGIVLASGYPTGRGGVGPAASFHWELLYSTANRGHPRDCSPPFDTSPTQDLWFSIPEVWILLVCCQVTRIPGVLMLAR